MGVFADAGALSLVFLAGTACGVVLGVLIGVKL